MDAVLLDNALPYALRATALLSVAALAVRLLAGRSAAIRHRVWALAIAGLAVLPFVSTLLPTWRVVPFPEPRSRSAVASPGLARVPAAESPASPGPRVEPASPTPFREPSARGSGSPALAALAALWALGTSVLLARQARDLVTRTRLGRRARPLGGQRTDAKLRGAAVNAATDLGILRSVAVRCSDDLAVPVTWGLFRPTVVLPDEAGDGWTDDRLRAVMLHELAHVARGDAAWLLAARAVIAFHWFNPLAWWALARLQVEAEHAADDRVLAAGFRPAHYAGHLVSVARALRARLALPAAAVPMARSASVSSLESRIGAILATGRARRPLGAGASLASLAVAASLVLPLAAAGCSRIGAHPSSSHSEESSGEATNGYFAQPRLAGQCDTWLLGHRGHGYHVRSYDDGRQMVTLRQAGCRLEITIAGAVRLGEGGIDDVADGAYLHAVETSALGTREILVAPGEGAGPSLRYKENGEERPFESAGREFLDGVSQEIERSTEVGAAARVARVYAAGGLDGALAEIGGISSGYLRGACFSKLIESGKLSPEELARAIEAAGRLVEHDHERAGILKEAFDTWPEDRPLPDELFRAAASLESDHEQSRLIRRVVRERPIFEAERLRALRSLDGIASEYERSETLRELIERRAPSAEELPVVLAAAGSLGSEYERGQLLHRLIESRGMTDAEVEAILGKVRTIGSEYERAELLISLAQRHPLGEPLLQAYVAVAEGLGSEHDQNRSLAAAMRNRTRTTAP